MRPRTIDSHGSGMTDLLVDDVVVDVLKLDNVLVVGDVPGEVSMNELVLAQLCTETD